MSGLFGNIAFLNPWLLAALAALPGLWFLLRVMPPAPRLVKFPAVHFLKGLAPNKQTSSHAPWWILLLRLFIAALVIVALAHPVHNPSNELAGDGPVQIVIDNDWAAVSSWDKQTQAAIDIAQRSERAKRDVYLLTTAPRAGQKTPLYEGLMTGAQAAALLQNIEPLPWPADYGAALDLIGEKNIKTANVFWLGHGLNGKAQDNLASALAKQGQLTYMSPEHSPLVIKPADDGNLSFKIDGAQTSDRPITVQALNKAGQIIDRALIKPSDDTFPLNVIFDLPETLQGDITKIRIAGQSGAGGIYLLGDNASKPSVGIIGPSDDSATKPFIEDLYYLKRALEPFTTLHIGDATNILAQSPSMIILPDIGAMPTETLNALEKWVKDGGLLLRFAGENMSSAVMQNFLTPLPLRTGLRSTEGSLSWENPPKLLPFTEDSPFYGLQIRNEIKVRQQILPQSAPDEDKKIWAALDDGTPLITGAALDKGLLVMIHTTASAEWSDLALSGTYVEILQRLTNMSGRSNKDVHFKGGLLKPLWVLDGFGKTQKAKDWARSIKAIDAKDTPPSSKHPPGIYEQGSITHPLNIGDHIGKLTAANMPSDATIKTYNADYELSLMPHILTAAIILLMLDWLIMITMISGFRLFARVAAIIFLTAFFAPASYANDDLTYADGLYLAYIKTGDITLDSTSQRGLENLATALTRRTSAEPSGVAALNPEQDSLSLFPLIYWPINAAQQPPSDKALQKIQHYLDNGGTILFDTRDQSYAANNLTGTKNMAALRRVTQFLNIPPLGPIGGEHVLGRAFYLLDSFPGQYRGGTLWVENEEENGRDGVSSIIIGSHDWASAWASDRSSRNNLAGGARQQELSIRFGVNLVMYALTGNYKADQVHVPHILERLGE